MCALDVDHLELDARAVYLPSRIQKGPPAGDTRTRPRHRPPTLAISSRPLERHRRPASHPLKRLPHHSALQRLVEKLATEADARPQAAGGSVGEPDDVTPHTLRHSVAYRITQVDDDAVFTPVRGTSLTEVRLSTLRFAHIDVFWADGEWFWFIPYSLFYRGVQRIAARQPFVFYLHPWEIDPNSRESARTSHSRIGSSITPRSYRAAA